MLAPPPLPLGDYNSQDPDDDNDEGEDDGKDPDSSDFIRGRTMTKVEETAKKDAFLYKGYVTMRSGAGVHIWDVRYLNLRSERTKKAGMFSKAANEEDVYLTVYTSHSMWGVKKEMTFCPEQATCMRFQRDCYDMGRRAHLWGIRSGPGKDPFVFDAEDEDTCALWIKALVDAGIQCEDEIFPSTVNSSSAKEGWLLKKGGSISTWRQRYVILMPQMCLYYKYKNGVGKQKPLGLIPLMGNSTVVEDSVKANTFIICADPSKNDDNDKSLDRWGSRNFHLTCHNESGMKEWMVAIRAVIAKLN